MSNNILVKFSNTLIEYSADVFVFISSAVIAIIFTILGALSVIKWPVENCLIPMVIGAALSNLIVLPAFLSSLAQDIKSRNRKHNN